MPRHGTLDSARVDSASLAYEFSNRKIGPEARVDSEGLD